MSVDVYELKDSGTGTVSYDFEAGEVRECTRRFLIGQCQGGFNEAVLQIEPYAPRYVSGGYGPFWTRRKLDVRPAGNLYYEISATYSTLLPVFDVSQGSGGGGGGNQPLAGGIAWDTTGGSAHITQAYSTTSHPAGAPDVNDAINISGDSVQGVTVTKPSLRYSETWIVPAALAISGPFVNAVYTLTGTVNQSVFRIFQPGEALFMGARAQWQGGEPFVAVTFDFECRANNPAEYVRGTGGTFMREGWQHLWVMYDDKIEQDRLVKLPKYAFIQDVYQKKDWAGLLISGISPAGAKTGKNAKPGQRQGVAPRP